MKKYLMTLFCIVFSSLVLVSCNENDGGKKDAAGRTAGEAASPKPDGRIVVGFSQVGAESDWRRANTISMRDTFAEANGYRLLMRDAQQKQTNQFAAIREFVQKKVDYIVLAPVTETGWDDVLKEAKDAGIPVIIIDRMVKTADPSLYVCWVGSDFRKEGGTAVTWMEKKFKGKEKLIIAHIQGNIGSSAQIGRTEGLQAGVDRNLGWKVVVRDTGNFTQVQGKEVMERILSEYNNIDVLYCENDNMAFGAMKAMDEANVPYGSRGGVTIISFDATRGGLEATLAGKISYNVECNPLHGPRVEKIIQQLKEGRLPNRIAYVDEMAFDATTITREEIDARSY
ncbi:MAG: ABC transporter substrate-binding protein [Desulfovibrio sp.]|nr:ABC transporter substrate-binding protein [Desulfovibrio sp.]